MDVIQTCKKENIYFCLPPCQLDGQYTASGFGLLWAAKGRLEEAADRLQRPGPHRQGDGQDQVPRHAEGGDGVRGRGCQEVAAAVRLQEVRHLPSQQVGRSGLNPLCC
jgi:hypothetical protein